MTRLWGLIWQGCWVGGHRWRLAYTDEVIGDRMAHRQCTRCGRWKAFRL